MDHRQKKIMTRKWLVKELVNYHKAEDFLAGEYLDAFLIASKLHFRENAFEAHDVLKSMDYAIGFLSCSWLESLRSIDREYFDGSKGCHTIIPSKGSI